MLFFLRFRDWTYSGPPVSLVTVCSLSLRNVSKVCFGRCFINILMHFWYFRTRFHTLQKFSVHSGRWSFLMRLIAAEWGLADRLNHSQSCKISLWEVIHRLFSCGKWIKQRKIYKLIEWLIGIYNYHIYWDQDLIITETEWW